MLVVEHETGGRIVACSRGDEEIACDESGSDGKNLLAGNTDVFAHGSVRLPTDVAAECFRELRHRILSPAEEYKANHLLREKHRAVLEWLPAPGGRSMGMPTSMLFSRTEACSLVSASQHVVARRPDPTVNRWHRQLPVPTVRIMDDTDAPPRLTRLTFHGPLSEDRAARLIRQLADGVGSTAPATVLDIGCGWGEFMLRLLEAMPGATGVGIDLNEDDLARGRTNAEMRGLTERVDFVRESAADTDRGPADIVLCFSASHALSDAQPPEHTSAALHALRRLVKPGGRVLLGEGFWQRPPVPSELSAMWPEASASEFHDLCDLVDLAIAAGFRPA
jgi:2-polyprenyl-3-methyl-5-hydroxy-6-metoxy-1,4-benzoquinol methylase